MFQRIRGAGTGQMWPVAPITPTSGSDWRTEKESGDPTSTGVLPRGRNRRKPSEVIGDPRARKERNLLCLGDVKTKIFWNLKKTGIFKLGKDHLFFFFLNSRV